MSEKDVIPQPYPLWVGIVSSSPVKVGRIIGWVERPDVHEAALAALVAFDDEETGKTLPPRLVDPRETVFFGDSKGEALGALVRFLGGDGSARPWAGTL